MLKQKEIKNFIDEQNIKMIAILKTKLNASLTQKACKLINPIWSSINNLQEAPYGRILIMWDSTIFTANHISSTSQFIHIHCTHISTATTFYITFVYALNIREARNIVFHDVQQLNTLNLSWLLIEDFNSMYLSHQKYGGVPLALCDILPLNRFPSLNMLIPAPTTGTLYTWNNRKHDGPRTFCTLDHCFINY